MADYLASENVPFQVAVIPIQLGKNKDGSDWYGLSLKDRPEVVKALQYMQEKGGTLIQHGTTHQMGTGTNPYSGRSGRTTSSTGTGAPPRTPRPTRSRSAPTTPTSPPWRGWRRTTWRSGRNAWKPDEVMVEAGLGETTIFETRTTAGP